jgi:hypothetical protein
MGPCPLSRPAGISYALRYKSAGPFRPAPLGAIGPASGPIEISIGCSAAGASGTSSSGAAELLLSVIFCFNSSYFRLEVVSLEKEPGAN